MIQGGFAVLALNALHATSVDPLDDPRWIVSGLAEGPLRHVLARYPLCRETSPAAPEYEFRRGVVVFRGDRDPRVWGHRVRMGLAAVLLMANGIEPGREATRRLAGWLALPSARATMADVHGHPYAPADVLMRELAHRDASTSGIFPVDHRYD